MTNNEKIGRSLEELRNGIRPVCEATWRAVFGDDWLTEVAGRDRHASGTPDPKDLSFLLKGMIGTWNDVWRSHLGYLERSYVSEIREVRNRWAHQDTFSDDDAVRAIDTTRRLLRSMGVEASRQVVRSSPDVGDLAPAVTRQLQDHPTPQAQPIVSRMVPKTETQRQSQDQVGRAGESSDIFDRVPASVALTGAKFLDECAKMRIWVRVGGAASGDMLLRIDRLDQLALQLFASLAEVKRSDQKVEAGITDHLAAMRAGVTDRNQCFRGLNGIEILITALAIGARGA